jgi:hypothetical protein
MDTTNIRNNSISSREANNIHQGPLQQQQDLTTRKLAKAVGLAPVEIPTTILPPAGTPTATEVRKQYGVFGEISANTLQNGTKFVKKDSKGVKIAYFLSERFWSVC